GRPDTDRIAGRIHQSRTLERHLDVAHVLRRVAARDLLVGQDFTRERVGPRKGRYGRRGAPHDLELRDRLYGRRALFPDFRDEGRLPDLCRLLVVDVAVDPLMHALGPEGLEARIEFAADG